MSLPPENVILREGDFSKSYGSVFMKALLDGDMEFVRHIASKSHRMCGLSIRKNP